MTTQKPTDPPEVAARGRHRDGAAADEPLPPDPGALTCERCGASDGGAEYVRRLEAENAELRRTVALMARAALEGAGETVTEDCDHDHRGGWSEHAHEYRDPSTVRPTPSAEGHG